MSDYDTDILLWSEQQADLLRRHARRGLPDTIEGQAPLPLPADIPTLDELLADDP